MHADKAQEQRLAHWISEYAESILKMCFLYLSDRTLAEDALQDTFFKAWRNIDQFEARNNSTERTWLMRIAINVCHDYHRSRWFRHVDMNKALEDLPPALTTISDADRTLFLDISRLPEKQKQVVLLYYYHDMTFRETAAILNIGESAVRYRLKKALATLRINWPEEELL